MIGTVDESGRALLPLHVRTSLDGPPMKLLAWIDTAFDGELVMPAELVEQLSLSQSAGVNATLADGSDVLLESFDCFVEWFGQWRQVEVIANRGWIPLLGTGLLRDRKLTIDFRANSLSLE